MKTLKKIVNTYFCNLLTWIIGLLIPAVDEMNTEKYFHISHKEIRHELYGHLIINRCCDCNHRNHVPNVDLVSCFTSSDLHDRHCVIFSIYTNQYSTEDLDGQASNRRRVRGSRNRGRTYSYVLPQEALYLSASFFV